ITSELHALVFTPKAGAPGSSTTTTFTLSDLSSANATPTVNSSTTVINTDPAAGAPIESFGSTSLVQVGSNYFMYPVGGSSGPELSYSGTPVVAGQFGTWTPIGAEQTASGYDVAWKVTGADLYSVWATDSSGNYTGTNIVNGVSGTSSALESL